MEHKAIESEAKFGVKGRMSIEVRDAETGALIPEESSFVDNVICDAAPAQLVQIWSGAEDFDQFAIAVGDDATTPVSSNAALNNEVWSEDATSVSATGDDLVVQLFLGTADANGYFLRECGLKHADVLLDHALITEIEKTARKTVTISITFTLSG